MAATIAVQFDGTNHDAVAAFAGPAYRVATARLSGPGRGTTVGIEVSSVDGQTFVRPGEWIVRGGLVGLMAVEPAVYDAVRAAALDEAAHTRAAALREAAAAVTAVLDEQYGPGEFKAEKLALNRATDRLAAMADGSGAA